MQKVLNHRISEYLTYVYGAQLAEEIAPRLVALLDEYSERITPVKHPGYFDETDAVLITYGDMVQTANERPLVTLYQFLGKYVGELITGVHVLPFYPYSSDDGFSVIDYAQVNPKLGAWADVEAFDQTFRLMFDAVINHISQRSNWFQGYLRGEEPYTDYFIEVEPETDLSAVFRPRALPLLTPVDTSRGEKYVWTTFSADQIDLNFASPNLLLDILEVLLEYVAHGAEMIRLDAIAFMWKEPESNCLHLPQTHALIQLMRAILDEVAPQVLLITETNVPHEENISYFGDGYNEAQMVYNFSLPPLTLHAFHQGNAEILSRWAAALTIPSPQTSFFNFLASHDGIGLTPARGLLADEEIQEIAARVEALGGYVSYRSNPDGSESPYELNISYIDALGEPGTAESVEIVAGRFLAAQAIMLALRGVPGIYFHSLFGSRSWHEGVQQSGQKRHINRQKLDRSELETTLDDQASIRAQVFYPYMEMLQRRTSEPAFHPTGGQEVIQIHPALFALWRRSPAGDRQVLCLHNVSDEMIAAAVDLAQFPERDMGFVDLLSGVEFTARDDQLSIEIPPYGVYWLRPCSG